MDDALQFVKLGEALFHAHAPLIPVKAVAGAQIDAGQMPVSEKLGDVGDLVGQFRQVDPEAAQMSQRPVGGLSRFARLVLGSFDGSCGMD